MKNYRTLVAVVLVFMMALSIYTMINSSIEQKAELDALQKQATELAEKGLYDKAVDKYKAMIFLDNKVDYHIAICNLYRDSGNMSERVFKCEETVAQFPNEPAVYATALQTYIDGNMLNVAFEMLGKFDGRQLQSAEVDKLRDTIEYSFFCEYLDSDEVGEPCGNFVTVCREGKWGYITMRGDDFVKPGYVKAGPFGLNSAAVLTEDGAWYQLGADGIMAQNISSLVEGKIEDVGITNDGLTPICVDGKYGYYNENFEKVFGEYDFAGGYNHGVAPVRTGDSWSIVNTEGKIIADGFQDISLDHRGLCCMQERMAVKKDGKYYLAGMDGKAIGKQKFDEMKCVSGGTMFAVKLGGKWGFVDLEGKIAIEPAYEDAHSFSNELAAVKKDSLWGFINEKNKMVIPAIYSDCSSMSSGGCALVQEGDVWSILKLYSKNY